MNNIPISTQWTLDAVGDTGRSAINSVFLIYCDKTRSKGTGFLLNNGLIITNEHVVKDCEFHEVIAITSYGKTLSFRKLIKDNDRDLAILFPKLELDGGLSLNSETMIDVGTTVNTWGHPLGYNGPNPLLSVGYVAGYSQQINNGTSVKHLVVNGAFNPGNSGGPLFKANDDSVIGIVVSKHAPISQYHSSLISALSRNNHTGVVYTYTDSEGIEHRVNESQIVADVLIYFRDLTQVMIGEAITANELQNCLEENGLST